MPLPRGLARSASASGRLDGEAITVGLINNMPDAALEATERQFADLIGAAAGTTPRAAEALCDPRGAAFRIDAARDRRALSRRGGTLGHANLDGLIVTGAEPRTKNLKDEAYWRTLTQVVDWARDNTASTIWSCLAAHAAVLHADGIERRLLPEKLSECSRSSRPLRTR